MTSPCPRHLCALCGAEQRAASRWRTALDFARLYLTGVVELLRQLFLSARAPRPACAALHPVNASKPVVLLSGGTSGIGAAVGRALSGTNARTLHLTHGRAAAAAAACVHVDLSCASSTARAARELERLLSARARDAPVVLVHCAGVYHPRGAGGVAETARVNLLHPALLLRELGRLVHGVVWLGSSSQAAAPLVEARACPLCVAATPYAMYPLSKLLCVLAAEAWGRSFAAPVMVVHPGVVATGLYKGERGLLGCCLRAVLRFCAWGPEEAAARVLTVVNSAGFWEDAQRVACGSKRGERLDGVYWDTVSMRRSKVPAQLRGDARRVEIAGRLWSAIGKSVGRGAGG